MFRSVLGDFDRSVLAILRCSGKNDFGGAHRGKHSVLPKINNPADSSHRETPISCVFDFEWIAIEAFLLYLPVAEDSEERYLSTRSPLKKFCNTVILNRKLQQFNFIRNCRLY